MQLKHCLKKICASLTYLILLTPNEVEGLFASTKSLGMAAAVCASPQDALIAAFNPAGITQVGDRFDLGVNYIYTTARGKIKDNLNSQFNGNFDGSKTKDIFGPEFGIVKDLPAGVSVGLALYNSNYLKTKYDTPISILGSTKAGLEYVHETAAATLAWQINPCQSIGVSVNYMVQRFKVEGMENLALVSAFPLNTTNRGYNYSNGVGVTLGWLGHFTPYFSAGVSYRPRTHMRAFDKYKGFFANRGKFDIPTQIIAGLAFYPCWDITLTFDIQYIKWREIRSLRNQSLPNILVHLAGTRHGPGFDWSNQTFYRLGFAYQLNDQWTVRAGYRYSHTPLKRRSTLVNLLTLNCAQSYLTAGATWSCNPCTELSFCVAYGFENQIEGDDLPANFGGGHVDLKEQKFLLGLSWGQVF